MAPSDNGWESSETRLRRRGAGNSARGNRRTKTLAPRLPVYRRRPQALPTLRIAPVKIKKKTPKLNRGPTFVTLMREQIVSLTEDSYVLAMVVIGFVLGVSVNASPSDNIITRFFTGINIDSYPTAMRRLIRSEMHKVPGLFFFTAASYAAKERQFWPLLISTFFWVIFMPHMNYLSYAFQAFALRTLLRTQDRTMKFSILIVLGIIVYFDFFALHFPLVSNIKSNSKLNSTE